MNPLVIAIIASILAPFAIACSLKLIDIGSNFANYILKYGPIVACLLGVVAVFNFMLVDTLELLSIQNVALVGVLSLIASSLLVFFADIIRRGLLTPKRAKSRKSGRVSGVSVSALFVVDLISGIIAGAVAGVSFVLNIGTGVIVICALMMLILDQKIKLIQRYQKAHLSRAENITLLMSTLVAFPVVASLTCFFTRRLYAYMGAFLALALGYLLSLSLIKAVEIVKKLRKS